MHNCVVVQAYLHRAAQDLLRDRFRLLFCESNEAGVAIARQEKAVAIVPGPTWDLSAAVFDSLPGLLVVARPGIGVDKVDVAAASERGVVVVNTPDAPTVSTAEHTVSLLLAVAKGHRRFAEVLCRGKSIVTEEPAVELEGKVLGLVGLGRVGRKVAWICGQGLGMKVVAYDPYVSASDAAEFNVTLYSNLDELLRIADFVSLHCPPREETRSLINARTLAVMKPTANLINCARGAIVDENALVSALQAGRIAGAGLDVFDPEPLATTSPLIGLNRVVLSPHSAGYTDDSLRKMGLGVARQILQILNQERPEFLLNPEVWNSPRRRRLAPGGATS